jgi:Tfp pilus assembly protein PilF
VALLAQAAELHPEDAQIQVNLAVAYLQMGRTSDAKSALETALTLDPESGEAELDLGFVLGQRAAHALALPHFRRAAVSLPGLADAHYNLGTSSGRP